MDQQGVTGIGAVAVPVTDQDKAVAFYVGVLGMEKRLDVPLERFGGRWITVAPPGSGTEVALVPESAAQPAGREVGVRFSTGDAAALHAAMKARGVEVDELLEWEGTPPMFAFRDQDGNGHEIVQYG
ncbi:VOC family protein [Spirillospora sp. NPDC029432]|uniref:VOC family protein n=1 Tax=Spirillospora sp. NPDC029432 TaxID=3154599 RepID=UPI0034550CC2